MDADGTPFRDEDYGENDYDSESDASANVDDAASDAGSVSSAASDSGSDGSESSEDADGDKKMMPLVDNDDDDVDLWDSDDEAWGVKSDPFYTWRDCVLGPLMDSLGPVNAAAMTEREALAKDMAYLSEDFQRYLYDSTRRNELRDVAHWDELHKGSSGGTEDNVAYTMMINDADADTIGDRCFVRLYGTTKHGHSVMATLENYRPYFYADMPGGRTALNPRELLLLQNELNYALQAANIKKGDVVQIEQVAKKTTDGYEGPVDPKELGADVAFPLKPEQIPPRPMLRIFCKTTKGIKTLRTAIEQGKVVGSSFYGRGVTTPTYESNIPYLLRVLIDRKIAGGSWVSFPRQYVRNMLVQGTGWDHKMQSRCQVELFIDAERMVAHDYNDAAWGGIAPFRIMSYDIEVNNDNDRFPTPYDADALARTGKYTGGQEVIMIANEGWHFGQDVNKDQRVFRCLLMQRTCDRKLVFDRKTGRPEDVFFFCNEKSLLLAWRVLVHVFDPDMFTGYNIVNFDTPYMINRPKALDPNAKPQQQQQQPWNGSANVNALNSSSYKMRFLSDRSAVIGIDDRFCRGLGRLKRHYVTIKEKSFSSKARGTVKRREASLHGLVQYDMYSYVTREKKYASYKLGYVANKIIGETKDDVHHSLISRLYNGNDIERSVLANYCIKDSMLPRKIMEKEIAIFRDVEMARCSGVLVRTLMEQGQQIKVISQIARKAREQDRVIHVIPEHLQVVLDENEKGYRGATVIEPDAGFYDCPVFTLDFASLYPSIMIAHNLCYTTIIQDEKKKAEFKARWPEVDSKGYHIYWTENENGDLFVSEKVVPGLLTLVLQDFLGKRKIAKKAMEAAELDGDYVTMQVMNARQLALKVSANSVYGFTGATRGRMPLLAIAATVTEVGRKMIAKTKQEVEEHFCKKNGFRFDAKVRYGDTDSVMVQWGNNGDGCKYIAESFVIGKQAAKHITAKHFKPPIQLEYEKTFAPYLLIAKKRYTGLFWTHQYFYDKVDFKGLELVRRDSIPITRSTMEAIIAALLNRKNYDAVCDPYRKIYKNFQQAKKKWFEQGGPKSGRPEPEMVDFVRKANEQEQLVTPGARLLADEPDFSTVQRANVEVACNAVRDSAQKFIEHKIDMSHMVLSASLNKDIGKLVELKRKGQMPKGLGAHYRLAMAAYERDPDGAPQIGQRLSYIVINGPKGAKMSDRVMNPMEALERNVSPDYRYYLEHKFVKSVERLMIPIIGKDKTAQLFKGHNSRVSIKETPSTTSKTSIMGFVKKLPTCVVCKAGISRKPLRSDYGVEIGGDAVPCDSQGRALRFSIEMNKVAVHPELARPAPNLCDHCREKHYPDVQQKLENRCKSLDREIKKMKAKCVKCQGDRYGVMECSTDDCAIFYRRIGARRELLQAKIDLRNLDW